MPRSPSGTQPVITNRSVRRCLDFTQAALRRPGMYLPSRRLATMSSSCSARVQRMTCSASSA